MTLHLWLLGSLLAIAYGSAYHLLRGGGLGRFVLYLITSSLGFWAGHFIALLIGWDFARLGSLRLIPATLLAFLFLGMSEWLTAEPSKDKG